ncbi:hypothetical protein PMI42_03476 [Bradyrhizobium sp. YR681]|nr:hypothetical protein PMI42_03476 [Bradyrhizobium sp. YR681]
MIRGKANRLILALCFVLAPLTDRIARAQAAKPEAWYHQCANWTPPPWDKPGTKRLLFPVKLPPGEFPGTFTRNSRSDAGAFVSPGDIVVSLISEPGRTEPSTQFVTRSGAPIEFFADASDARRIVSNGRLASAPPFGSALYAIACVKSASGALVQDETAPGRPTRMATPSDGEPRLIDLFASRETSVAERSRRGAVDAPTSAPAASGANPPASPKISDLFGGAAASPSDDPKSGRDGTPASAPGRPGAAAISPESPATPADTATAPTVKAPEAAGRDGVSSRAVCDARSLAPLSMPNGTMVTSLQAVGIRNGAGQAKGFEYSGSDTRPLGDRLNIGSSARQLVPYEVVAERRLGSEPLLVSIAGAEPDRRAIGVAKTAKTIRTIVVAGAAELSMSGLDLVGRELKKPGGEAVRLEIEWHSIDETGAVRHAGSYSSFEQLVKEAAARNRERPDVLGESQLLTLFDDVEKLLKAQTRPFDKVFWIKGAYAIPSSIPRRFERLIATVSSSSAAPHTPSGQLGKWLVVVTSRMPGFSLAYLKEPIYSLQIGDVIEEAEASAGPRHLISDPVVLAARLRSTGSAAKTDGETARPAPIAKLAFDARDVFAERGYVLSPDAAVALQIHLQRVSRLWDAAGLRPETLTGLENGTGKPQAAMLDILQASERSKYPQLPGLLPDWFRKPVRTLTPDEAKSAGAAVAAYLAGVNRLAVAAREATANPHFDCQLLYVAEASFGFDRLGRPAASKSLATGSDPRSRSTGPKLPPVR